MPGDDKPEVNQMSIGWGDEFSKSVIGSVSKRHGRPGRKLVPAIPIHGARPCVPKRDRRNKSGDDSIVAAPRQSRRKDRATRDSSRR